MAKKNKNYKKCFKIQKMLKYQKIQNFKIKKFEFFYKLKIFLVTQKMTKNDTKLTKHVKNSNTAKKSKIQKFLKNQKNKIKKFFDVLFLFFFFFFVLFSSSFFSSFFRVSFFLLLELFLLLFRFHLFSCICMRINPCCPQDILSFTFT